MSDLDRRFERAARAWLEAGPAEAPDRAIQASLLAIETTPQERDLRVPWRFRAMPMPARLAAAAAILLLVAGGGLYFLRPSSNGIGTTPTAAPSPAASVNPSPTPTPPPKAGGSDYSTLKGRILMEHLGNAPDGAEPDASADYHTDRRRFYWMDPTTMTGKTAVQFLPGQPSTGKTAGDVSRDLKRIVFQDADPNGEHIWIANLDGSGLTKLDTSCPTTGCAFWDPAFDPTGTKIVYVRRHADDSTVLVIKDLAAGAETVLSSSASVARFEQDEQPAWSPDGKTIAFDRISWPVAPAPGVVPTKGTILLVDIATNRTTPLSIGSQVKLPGDPHWSPDGSRILFIDGPVSTAAVAFSDRPGTGDIYTSNPDGSALTRLTHTGENVTADFTPDGQYVLYFDNYFWLMRSDGSQARPVNINGSDLSEMNVGFGYVGHWIPTP